MKMKKKNNTMIECNDMVSHLEVYAQQDVPEKYNSVLQKNDVKMQ